MTITSHSPPRDPRILGDRPENALLDNGVLADSGLDSGLQNYEIHYSVVISRASSQSMWSCWSARSPLAAIFTVDRRSGAR